MSSSSARQYPGMQLPDYERNKSRIFFAIACFWPFVLLALFASSAPRVPAGTTTVVDESPAERLALRSSEDEEIVEGSGLRLKLRNVLDRVDIMGYGPTHPRIGVVVTGPANAQDKSPFTATVDSIFSHTDLSRIFVVTVVVDGHKEDPAWEGSLKKINHGQIPHLHGLRLDLHQSKQQSSNANKGEESQHESKVHVMFNEEARGVTASRQDGADFIHILAKHHERAGLKSPAEDIILLVIEAGTVLTSRKWLPTVTEALIVPPPILPSSEMEDVVSLKMANAVSFNVEGSGKRTSFDAFLTPQIGIPNAEELNLSSGTSYMAPAWNGAALALRLETYRQLPMHDEALMETWPANLDLSMALWLCADGIDMIQTDDDALVVKFTDSRLDPSQVVSAPLSPALGARFAEAWMDEELQRKFFHSYTHEYDELTYLEWQTYQAQARMSPSFVKDLSTKCRSMSWYINKVNSELSSILEQSAIVDNAKPIREEPLEAGKKFESLEKFLESQKDSGGANEVGKPKGDEEGDEDSVAIPGRREELKKPSKPICDECLKIVEKAKPVDLTYVDMTGGHKDHPHMGAKDVNGNYGFVHNATHLHDDPPKFNMPEEALIKACKRRDNNYRMLTEKVRVDFKGDKEAEHTREKRARIFCLVYTIEKAHSEIPRIRETWGQKCDGFMVASTKSDPSIDAVEIPHEGPEEYNNIWQKVRSMWSYIYDNYYDDFDWFHIGGDDYYLLVENLRLYLESEEIQTASNGGTYLPTGDETYQTPLFLGRRFAYMGDMDDIFNSGGSGYTLNKAALKTLVVEGLPSHRPHAKTFSEDTVIARLFRKYGIFPYDTKDSKGGERYMPFMPGHHYGYRMPADRTKDWYAHYSIDIKEGPDHCAENSLAFHYVKGDSMYRLHALLYDLCPPGTA